MTRANRATRRLFISGGRQEGKTAKADAERVATIMAKVGRGERITALEARELFAATNKAKIRNKYGARRVVVDGHSFPSALEARRYGQLKLLLRAGKIVPDTLKLQPRFPLKVDGVEVGTYVADFAYTEVNEHAPAGTMASEIEVVEDAKGLVLALYALKRSLFRQLYPHLNFREIKR